MNDRLRAQVIAEWRGLPETPFPKDTSRAVGEILGKVIADLGLQARMRDHEILTAWGDIVGEFIARHSTPMSLIEGVLYVRVIEPSVRYELENTFRADILKKLKERFGRTVRQVRFRLS